MSYNAAGVKVVSILGEDYSIKAPAGEEQTLLDAALMLKAALADTKRKYPTLIGDRLLVLAAPPVGFADGAERQLFLHLLTVAGIGPKVALAIVSGAPATDLRRAIVLQDAARFQAVPGVGKKTAERIVLELKEKLGAEDPVPISTAAGTSVHVTARDALVELGYSVLEAEQALASVDPDLPVEERVRLALRQAA